MSAIIQRTLEEFTGPDVGSLEKLPAVIPVLNYARRYAAEHFWKFSDGTLVSSWQDVTSGSAQTLSAVLSKITGATSPRLSTTDGKRVVSFNGTTDAIGGSFATSDPTTFSVVVYLPGPLTNKFLVTTIDSASTFAGLGIEGAGLVKYWGEGYQATGQLITAGWHVITVVSDGANTRVYLDGVVSTNIAPQTGTFTQTMINFGGSVHSASRARMDLAEFVLWRRALSATEISSVYATFKAHYEL